MYIYMINLHALINSQVVAWRIVASIRETFLSFSHS